MGTDSQAVIKVLQNQCSHPGHYLLNAIHLSAERLHVKQDRLINSDEWRQVLADRHQWKGSSKGIINLQLHWVPSHCDFGPNERADEEAKQVTQGSSSEARFLPRVLRKKLPLSVSALRQENNVKLKKRWQRRWKNSERENLLRTIDNSAPSKKILTPYYRFRSLPSFSTVPTPLGTHRPKSAPLPHPQSRFSRLPEMPGYHGGIRQAFPPRLSTLQKQAAYVAEKTTS